MKDPSIKTGALSTRCRNRPNPLCQMRVHAMWTKIAQNREAPRYEICQWLHCPNSFRFAWPREWATQPFSAASWMLCTVGASALYLHLTAMCTERLRTEHLEHCKHIVLSPYTWKAAGDISRHSQSWRWPQELARPIHCGSVVGQRSILSTLRETKQQVDVRCLRQLWLAVPSGRLDSIAAEGRRESSWNMQF